MEHAKAQQQLPFEYDHASSTRCIPLDPRAWWLMLLLSLSLTSCASQPSETRPEVASSAAVYPAFPSLYSGGVRPPDDMVMHRIDEVDAAAAGALHHESGRAVLRFTHAGCGFVEAEPLLRSLPTGSAPDCRDFHRETFERRRQRILRVEADTYIIEVRNAGGERALGFWLREHRQHSPRTYISYGGVAPDQSARFTVTLPPGEYLYSCPLSPSADYLLRVTP